MQPIEQQVHDPNAEHFFIGYILNSNSIEHSEACTSLLDKECFFQNDARTIFDIITDLINQGQPPDLVHVAMCQTVQKPEHSVPLDKLAEWSNNARTQDIEYVIKVLRDFRTRRVLQALANTLSQSAQETNSPIAGTIDLAIRQLEGLDVVQQAPTKALHDIVPELIKRIEDNRNPDSRHHGPYIGLDEIDSLGGLPETGLVVLAGGTSSGKSSVAAGILIHSADAGMRGLYISLEMPNRSLVGRMTAMKGHGLSARDLLTRPLTAEPEFVEALGDIDLLDLKYGQMIYFDDSRSSNLDDICANIRQMTRIYGIRLAVVDFIQLLNYTMQSRTLQQNVEQLMAMASRRLKNLADRLGICIVMLSQLNRSMDRQRPTLGSVRDSGQIAEAADMVILTWRPEQYHGQYDLELSKYSAQNTMAILVAKNREGALMDIIARWDGKRTLMRQLTSLERTLAINDSTKELF